jgi:hypothetical protein
MDLFAWSNTVQASARVTVAPWAEGRLAVEYRYVRLAEAGSWEDSYLAPIASSGRGAELGSELDAWASWRPWPVLELVGGYSLLALSEDARQMLAVRELSTTSSAVVTGETAAFAHFAYLQATVRVP